MFSKQHYEKVAKELSSLDKSTYKHEIIIFLVRLFEKDNPNFKPDRFRKACGEI